MRQEGDDVPTVVFTPTTDRPTDSFCACEAAVTWLMSIPHLIPVTAGHPVSSLATVRGVAGLNMGASALVLAVGFATHVGAEGVGLG